jgi:uncharacterized protein
MKLSFHTIVVDDYPAKDQYLLYSTRTQALIKIDQPFKSVLNRLEHLDEPTQRQYDNELQYLHKMGLIVRDEQEDLEKLKSHLNKVKYSHDRSQYLVTILTTYACNFKCTYCFEESSRTTVKLDHETQEQVIRWLQSRMERFGYGSLNINYYGGEPLLNPSAIEYISSQMQDWCQKRGIGFRFSLQTNGYLLTPEKVIRFKELGLKNVRISVDGVGDDHDRSRPLRGGGGTFERIIQNIKDCADLIKISISVGYDKGDVTPIEKLVHYFDQIGVLHKLGQFAFSPLIPTLGPKGEPQRIQGSQCMGNSADKSLAEAARKLGELLTSRGVSVPSGMSTSVCPLTRDKSAVTIDQHGRLYRCNSLLGHPEFSVGDVRNDNFNDQHEFFRDLDVWQQCPVDCTYMPMCSGGCRLMSFVGGYKNFKVPSCKKAYLNEMSPEFIKRDYQRLIAAQDKLKAPPVSVEPQEILSGKLNG